MSWPTATLGEMCNIQIGRTPSRANKSYWEGGNLPWVSIGDISRSDRISSTKEMITERAATETGCKKIAVGTVLMSFKLSIGKIAIAQTPLFTNEAIAALEISKEEVLDPLFLFRAIENINFQDAGNRAAMGRTLNKQSLSEIEIPLPPLNKQRRIAAILDKTDVLRRNRKRALGLLDNLTRSIFREMFGDPETNQKGWVVHPLNEVVDIDAPLVDPKISKYKSLLHYGPDRIEKDTGRLLPALTAEQDGLISNKFLCNQSHILYSKIRPYLNKVALSERVCLCSADVYPISVKPEVADRVYVWHLLRSKAFLKFADSQSNRANIPKINREQFLSFEAPIPPLGLQRQFAERMNLSRLAAERSVTSNALANTLFTSLQHRVFSGELE